ncbi:hypothetical protein pb186bvf_003092 [Paramecium bursaria]
MIFQLICQFNLIELDQFIIHSLIQLLLVTSILNFILDFLFSPNMKQTCKLKIFFFETQDYYSTRELSDNIFCQYVLITLKLNNQTYFLINQIINLQ